MPASTGAAKAVTKVIPALVGKLTGWLLGFNCQRLSCRFDSKTSKRELLR